MSRSEPWYFDENPSELYERLLVPTKFLPWAKYLAELGNPQPEDKVLDIACGTGTVTRLIGSCVGASGAVTGLDFDAGRLEVAASLGINAGSTIDW